MNAPRILSTMVCLCVALGGAQVWADSSAQDLLKKIGTNRGIVAVLGLPRNNVGDVIDLAKASELTIYFQSADPQQVLAVRRQAESAGLLGQRIFADVGDLEQLKLADNIADCILVAGDLAGAASEPELLRALRPRGAAYLGAKRLLKPIPQGIDQWTHPYHGPDNNPQSQDQLVRGSLRTQFLAEPKFSPMPEQTVVAGGRIYKAMGHIAHKANQNAMLNTLLCVNAYNGTVLWRKPLPPGFMIHRNTMVATDEGLWMGDHQSCKFLNGATGKVTDEIKIDASLADGPVWKWMALRDGVLYGLVGHEEIKVDTQKSARRGLGHWPWAMWQGHEYKDPKTAFGFGRTIVAVDLKSKKVLWHHREQEFLDARGVCMNDRQLICYSPQRFLASYDLGDGKPQWKNSDKELLEAIGANGKAQHYVTGYATTTYIKCNPKFIFFAGPQRQRMVVASAEDGKLVWTHPDGNLQLVLRDDAIYGAGPQTTGVRLDYATGRKIGDLPTRRACTRATGCADSIFYRTTGGTVRVMTDRNTAEHIAPMRPPCQDGVIVSNGHLYWGPWMCGCQLSLYGHIGLGPAPETTTAPEEPRVASKNVKQVAALPSHDRDWTSYRGGNARQDTTATPIPDDVKLAWSVDVSPHDLPTSPVSAAGLIFIADRRGVVQAFNNQGQQVWKTYTAGAVYYAPAVAHDRLYVGSADGRVYALEAATGRFLWSYRVGLQDRRIPVFGQLISTWPVAGGVVVEGNTVYAAAGIAHYDGTQVVSLDAITGELKARNSTSGALSSEVNSGVSLQGNLMIVGGELRFLAGGAYKTARYDLETLECLNTPRNEVTSQFQTAFYPYYPAYGKYVSLSHACADGCTLEHGASYEGSVFSNLVLREPRPAGVDKPSQEARRQARRGEAPPKPRWQDRENRRFTSFIVSSDKLLAAGHRDEAPEQAFLAAINVTDGSTAWQKPLPADAVKGGAAIDRDGRVLVALENGKLLCFVPAKNER